MLNDSISAEHNLRITEIFYSLQGETTLVGLPTVFIRLTGCPLRCQYCDTAYAFKGGALERLSTILQKVEAYSTSYVTVAGGEPLAQKGCLALLTMLCDKGKRVSLETSGALSVQAVDPRVIKIIDVKTPASGESERHLWKNFDYLLAHDQVKFVICDQDDFEWSLQVVEQYQLIERATVLFSPSYQQLQSTQLADWILEAKIPVRLQVQLHKQLVGRCAWSLIGVFVQSFIFICIINFLCY